VIWMIGRLTAAIAASVYLVVAPASGQETYPSRAIKIIAPFPAGAPVDSVARLIADRLERAWGQPVVVENRGGGGGIVGTNAVAKAAPDGYTLLLTSTSPIAAAPALNKSMPYDAVKDLAPIWAISASGLVVVVNPALPIKTLTDLVRLGREQAGKLSFASSGHGTSQHLAGELFMARTGAKLVHVPYRGGFAGTTDLMAGHVQVMFDSLGNVLNNIRSEKLRALAVLRDRRSPQLPSLPTAAEAGVNGVELGGWLGLFAPAGTPPAIRDRLTSTLLPAMREPAIMARLIELGNEDEVMTGDIVLKRLAEDRALFAEIVERAGIVPQ
jgi:tripartite-type tricarboxylate transporter receptor subunit TctC